MRASCISCQKQRTRAHRTTCQISCTELIPHLSKILTPHRLLRWLILKLIFHGFRIHMIRGGSILSDFVEKHVSLKKNCLKKAFLGGHRFPVTSRWRVLEAKPDIWSTSGVPLRNFGTLHSSYVGGRWNQKWLHSRALLSFSRADTEKCEKMRSFVKRSVTKKIPTEIFWDC